MRELHVGVPAGGVLAVVGVLASGCVLPSNSATGLELSWQFRERNVADGEDATRVRTCSGAALSLVRYRITDKGRPTRTASFDFDCETGFKTESEFQTEASSAFIELRPGTYLVEVTGIGTQGEELLETSEIGVNGSAVTTELFTLSREPVTWSFALTGDFDCEAFGVALVYADPEDDLAELEAESSGGGGNESDGESESGDEDDPDEDGRLLYRDALESDRDLPLDGSAIACADAPAGVHVVEGIDVGRYRVVLSRDGVVCTQTVRIDGGTGTTTIPVSADGCDP